MRTALLVVDVQNDFVEGGALAVAGGLGIIPIINKVAAQLAAPLIVTSQDFHPLDHCSFDKNGGTWPVHCVGFSKGAELVSTLDFAGKPTVNIRKGTDAKVEAYSPFDGLSDSGLDLDTILKQLSIKHIYVCGIATNFCVRAAVLDAIKKGYTVTLIENAIVGVPNADPSIEQALSEMAEAKTIFLKAY